MMSVSLVLRQLRVHQWVKNGLLAVPLVLAHRITDWPAVQDTLLAIVAFCCTASAVYILNDLRDLEADRQHPTKRHRPLASGALSSRFAVGLVPVLVVLAAAVAIACSHDILAILGVYAVVTTAYTVFLKRLVLVDVLVLSGLYVLRLIAGGIAGGVDVSPWLLMLSLFLFTSIAFVKRYTELLDLADRNQEQVAGRGYRTQDADVILVLGAGLGLMSVLVLALYITSDEVQILYRHPFRLWAAVPVLMYWISWLWLVAHRGLMHVDPIVFMLRDRAGWFVVLALAAIVVAAT